MARLVAKQRSGVTPLGRYMCIEMSMRHEAFLARPLFVHEKACCCAFKFFRFACILSSISMYLTLSVNVVVSLRRCPFPLSSLFHTVFVPLRVCPCVLSPLSLSAFLTIRLCPCVIVSYAYALSHRY